MINEMPKQEINPEETGYDLFEDIDWIGLDDMDEKAVEDFTNQVVDFLSTEDVSDPEKFEGKLMRLRRALRKTSEANNGFYITDILAKMYSKLKWPEK